MYQIHIENYFEKNWSQDQFPILTLLCYTTYPLGITAPFFTTIIPSFIVYSS